MNIKKLMKQVQQMQSQLEEKLADVVVEGSAGGGAVKIILNGRREMMDINIDPGVLEPDNAEMVGELVRAAFDDACRLLDQETSALMSGVAGSLPI